MKIFSTLFVSAFFVLSAQAANYKIIGTVVNKQGKAIQKAEVLTYDGNTYERFVYSIKTDSNGKFEIEKEAPEDSFQEIFFLPAPELNTYSPISVPHWLSQTYPQLLKMRVKLGQENRR